jgi:hypothetical protein
MDKGIMGFDPSKCRMTAEEKRADSQAKAEGVRNRRAFIDSLLNLIAAPETDSDVIHEARSAWLWFPEGKQLVDRIQAVYGDKPEVLKTVLLSSILAAIEAEFGPGNFDLVQ